MGTPWHSNGLGIDADDGVATPLTPRVVLAYDSDGGSHTSGSVVADTVDQNEAIADIPVGIVPREILIQNTGTTTVMVAINQDTAAGTRGIILAACAVFNDGTGGALRTRTMAAIWLYALSGPLGSCQVLIET